MMKRLALLALLAPGTAVALKPAEPIAIVLAGARASLTPDGPLLSGKAKSDSQVTVIDTSHERYRFDEQGNGYRLALYVDPKHLATMAFRGTELTPTLTEDPPSDRSPGMKLDGGQRVASVRDGKNGFSKVRIEWKWQTGSFRVEGYVKSDRLTKTIGEMSEVRGEFKPDTSAPGNFKLAATPGGKPFATSKNKFRVDVQSISTQRKHTLVRTPHGTVGWIATKLLAPGPPVEMVGELGKVGHGSGTGRAPRRGTLSLGTALFDQIDGVEIGEVTGQFDYPAVQTKAGWTRHDLPTTFGVAKVWAKGG
jgi:hypothetical protein